ncbi:hypothetical protein DSO57_1027566 [Entomophthora muscae]|uniref:Uncharacterized protein n=1 Tax=Entomophthora muscae TaxID=34485 RepID=A0ACC2U0Q4_9FUNG|nr:hypothetical protein DSO57_1027566 [Entomophthora muscae]
MELDLFDEFSFDLGSDSEEEVIDIQAQKELERKARQDFLQECSHYRPYGGEKKWFSLASDETVVGRIRAKKNAGSEIKHLIEHHYLKKDYKSVIEIGKEFLDNIGLSKVNNTKELVEILIRAHLQLGDYPEALTLAESWKGSTEPGQVFLKAQVFSLTGNLKLSLELFRQYLITRPNDYLAWKEIGLAIERFYHEEARVWNCQPRATINIQPSIPSIATLCFKLSHRLMNNSKWNTETVEYVRNRFNKESYELKQHILNPLPGPEVSSTETGQDTYDWLLSSTSSIDNSLPSHNPLLVENLECENTPHNERSVLAL